MNPYSIGINVDVVKEFIDYAKKLRLKIINKMKKRDSSYNIDRITKDIVKILKKDKRLFKLYNYDENDELTLEAYAFYNDVFMLHDKSAENVVKKAHEFLNFIVLEKEFTAIVYLEGLKGVPLRLKLGLFEVISYNDVIKKYKTDIDEVEESLKMYTPQKYIERNWGLWGKIVYKTYQYQYSVQILMKELELPIAILSLLMKTDYAAKDVIGFIHYNGKKIASLYPLEYKGIKHPAWFKYRISGLSTYDKHMDKYTRMLSKISQKSKPTPLEKRILGAIRLYGVSNLSYRPEIRFTMIVFACDSLLTRSTECLTLKLSERTACLLEKTGKKRLQLYEEMKDMYDKRSKIVHKGSIDVNSQEVKKVEDIFYKLFFSILNIKTKYDKLKISKLHDDEWLEKYLDKIKFNVITYNLLHYNQK